VGIRYNVIRVYPLFAGQSQNRSKFSDLEKFTSISETSISANYRTSRCTSRLSA